MTASPRRHRGFTLLEVMVALAILVGALYVLVDSQAQALLATRESERVLAATMLAREKMDEVMVRVEQEGFGETDLEEEGDFQDFGAASDVENLDLDLDLGDEYADFRWAWTLRQIDLTLGGGGDLGGMADSLAGEGYWGEQPTDEERSEVLGDKATSGQDQQRDLSDIGITGDMIGEMLGNYIREVRVVVWWGENEDGGDQVEIVTHVINPTGVVMPGAGGTTQEADGGSGSEGTGSGGSRSSGTSGGGTSGMKTGGRSGGAMKAGPGAMGAGK